MEEEESHNLSERLPPVPMRTKVLGAGMVYFSIFLAFYFASAPVGSATPGALILTGGGTDVHLYEYASGTIRLVWSCDDLRDCSVTSATLVDCDGDGEPEIVLGVDKPLNQTDSLVSLLIYDGGPFSFGIAFNETVPAKYYDRDMVRARRIDYYGNGSRCLISVLCGKLLLVGYVDGSPVVKGRLDEAGVSGLDVGDVNGDGKPDIVYKTTLHGMPPAPRSFTSIIVRENQGNGQYLEKWVEGRDALGKRHMPFPIDELRIGDVDGDGRNEIVMVGPEPSLSVWGYSEGEYREIWSYFGETIQSVDLADFDGDGTAEIVTAAESILEPVESGVPGLSVWKYNSSGNSFYRLWEDVHTREYGLAYDSIAMGGMCVLRAGEVGEGNPGIFGIAWHPRLGGGCLYVAGKEGGDFGSITLPILSAQTLDIWPVDLAQSPRATWENRSAVWSQTYGGSLRDWGNAVVRTPDGGYIVAGGTRSFGNGDGDAFLVKVDGGGNKVWQRTYGGTKEDEALRIVAAGDGGYVVAGFTRLEGSWYSDAYIFKIDDDGNLVWEETYSGDETARSLVRSRDGGFVVAGSTLFKIDSKGQLVWDKPYDSMDVVLGADGGFVALSAITGGFRVLKLDDSGEIVWDRNFTRPGMNSVKGLAQIDGGYMIAGETEHGTQLPDAYLLLIDEQGNVVWEKDYGGLSWDSTLVALRSEDGYVVVGETWSAGAGAGDVYLLGLDGERKKLWEATYGMKDNDRVYGAAEAEDGGLVLAGETWSAGEGLSDLFLCKIGGYAWAFRGLGLEPSIVVPGRDATVLVQAETIGASSQGWGRISRVWLDLSSLHMPDAEMYDDGTRGDRIGGDGVYTALLPVIPDYPGGRHSVVARLVDDRGKQAYISAYLSVYPLGSLCVYDEGGEDWSAMGESATIATDSTRASSGLNSLFVSASSKGQVKFVPPGGYAFDSFGYESISFSLMPLDSGRFRPLVSVGIEGVVDLPKIDLYGLGQRFQSNQWTSISLPLSLFHANNQSISFVSIEVPVQGGFYLDDVRLKSAVQEHLLPAIVLLLVGAVAKLLSHQYVRGSGQIPVGDQVVSTGRTMCIGGMVSRPGGSGWS